MPELTESQFMQLSEVERRKVLDEMEEEDNFSKLSDKDRKGVLEVMQAVQKNPNVGQGEAAVRALGQGLTAGYADEIVAKLSAAGRKFLDSVQGSKASGAGYAAGPAEEVTQGLDQAQQPIPGQKSYDQYYDEELQQTRDRDKAAQAQWPKTFGATKVVGGVAPAIAAGGAGLATKGLIGALGGAVKGTGLAGLVGAGESEAQFGSEQFQKDVKKALLSGAAIQGMVSLPIQGAASIGSMAAKAVAPKILEKGFGKLMGIMESKISIPTKFMKVIDDAFSKQGAAGVAAAHAFLMQKPEYRKFLESED